MKKTRIEAKIEAREWIIAAIQQYSHQPPKTTERELRRFIRRLQRDLKQLERAQIEHEKGDAQK